jgi:hypothetical protein
VYLAATPEIKWKTGRDEVFVVLDEWHGALEVLDERPRHLGTLQLVIQGNQVRLGEFKPGATHSYEWIGG